MDRALRKKKYAGRIAGIGLLCMLALWGCASRPDDAAPPSQSQENGGNDTGFMLTGPGSYDSADTAVVTHINTEEKTITFYNYRVSKKYTLHYDGATGYADKYGQAMSLAQIREGDIVDITFLKSKKRLDSLRLSTDSWSNEFAQKYEFNTKRHDVSVGSDVYKITSDTLIFSQGQQIELMDLNSADILTFHGVDNTVYSIVVERGHGYLRLEGDENFIGGWIEVGQELIRPISEDMLLTVPEGSYDVAISLRNSGGVKKVIINRNKETTLNIGDLEVEEIRYGQILFVTTPSDASVYVDGAKVDTGGPVELEYGIHQVIATAAGCNTVTAYFRVSQPSASLDVTLTVSENGDDTDEEDETGSSAAGSTDGSASVPPVVTGSYMVHVDAPEGVEVYLDGNYIGISPVSFKKVEGAHIVTLRRTGYETRSYTIQVDNEEKDISYSFTELAPASSSGTGQ